ncbi:hypothetical protein ACFQJD_06770 [Haloplanus sp. GCM10025708]|uniref:hypothetical protein n=1 Tax=Haloplanus sp. GCM10025708 TaxID=3252679 RepID=UPI00361BB42A
MPTRRTLLRAGVLSTLGLAGCLAADGSGTPTATGTPTGTPTRSPTTARPTYRPSTVSLHLEPVSVPDVAEAAVETFDDLSRSQRDALDEIRETGAYTVTNVVRSDRLPFASEPFVRLGGEFFRVERETLAQRPRTVHRFHVEVLSRTQGRASRSRNSRRATGRCSARASPRSTANAGRRSRGRSSTRSRTGASRPNRGSSPRRR